MFKNRNAKVENGCCFYSALFHADLFTAAGLRIVVPFRGGIGVRHSFHGFVCAIQYRQPHFVRNALYRDRGIHHEAGDGVINIGQTVEFFDFIAGRGIQLLHLCPSIRPAYIFQFRVAGLFDFQMIFEVDSK